MDPNRTKNRRKAKNRCREKVINNLRKLKLKNWSQHVKDGKTSNDVVQKIGTQVRL